MVQQLRQFTAPHEMHPPPQSVLRGQAFDRLAQRRAAIFQRVRLDHHMVVARGPAGEAVKHQFQKLGLRGKRAMRLKAAVMFQLQQHQMIGKAAIANAPACHAPFQRGQGHRPQPAQIQLEFLRHAQVAVRAEVFILAVHGHDEEMIKRAVKHMVAHIAPMRGRVGQFQIAFGQSRAHLFHTHVHQHRITIRPAAFIGDPIGAQIPFLEHMHGQAQVARLRDSGRMDGPHIAIQDQISDLVARNDIGKGRGPVGLGRGEVDIAVLVAPEHRIATVETHTPDLRTRQPQHAPQTVEEGPVRPLQEQKTPVLMTWFHTHTA